VSFTRPLREWDYSTGFRYMKKLLTSEKKINGRRTQVICMRCKMSAVHPGVCSDTALYAYCPSLCANHPYGQKLSGALRTEMHFRASGSDGQLGSGSATG
jgi:hypothetical protein